MQTRVRRKKKLSKCRWCKTLFEPQYNRVQPTCSPSCALNYAREQEQKRKDRERFEQRKELRLFREKNRTIAQLVRAAQQEFNRYIRLRDAGKPCICCGKVPKAETEAALAVKGHLWDAGHYRSTGAAPHLRFNEDNCHAQLVFCNRERSGNAVDYRIGLIARIGLERVEALENNNEVKRWDRDELIALRKHYLSKWKDLKAQREQQRDNP